MEEAGGGESSRYWCHMCSQRVDPIREIEAMKCPVCESGFVEEIMANDSSPPSSSVDVGDRALSLWAPILLGMMANPIRYRSLRAPTEELEEEGHNNNNNNNNNGDGDEQGQEHLQEEEEDQEVVEEEQEEEEMRMRRRRRRTSAAAILQLLQSIRAGMVLENQEREGVILINPLNQTIIVHGGERPPPVLGLGLGLELLLQHLAENDPNRYGTPPANREAVEGLPTVQIEEAMQCAVCLDECEVGSLVKEMPCKHKFHSTCIVPWLQLHSSCPVCRYQLPTHESSSPKDNDDNDNNSNINAIAAPPFSLPQLLWPLTTLFSSSTSQAPTPTASLTYPHHHPLPSPSPSPSPSGDDAPPTTSSPHAAHHN